MTTQAGAPVTDDADLRSGDASMHPARLGLAGGDPADLRTNQTEHGFDQDSVIAGELDHHYLETIAELAQGGPQP